MKHLLTLILVSAKLFSQESFDVVRERFKQADRDFSKLSGEKGPAEAFATFLTDDAYLLHAGSLPVTGKENIQAQYADFPKDGSLTWEPTEANCSAAGDVGYTIGKYEAKTKNPDGSQRLREGTYMTVWKKQRDGSLKAIADLGPPLPTLSDSVGRTIKRTPIRSELSAIGDFGVSFGTYVMKLADKKGKTSESHGKYIRVWRRSGRKARILIKDVSSPSPAPKDN